MTNCSLKPGYRAPLDDYIIPVTETGCWIWLGAITPKGYAKRRVGSRVRYMHRDLFEAYVRPLEQHEVVMHICDVPSCVNPQHLRAGTTYDNIHDMIDKGRDRVSGERHGNAILTDDQAEQIRTDSRTEVQIASAYGISQTHAGNIRRGIRRNAA